MRLLLPSRYNQQPQGRLQIDWSNPITRGLLFDIDHSRGIAVDWVKGYVASASAPVVPLQVGLAQSFTGTGYRVGSGLTNAGLGLADKATLWSMRGPMAGPGNFLALGTGQFDTVFGLGSYGDGVSFIVWKNGGFVFCNNPFPANANGINQYCATLDGTNLVGYVNAFVTGGAANSGNLNAIEGSIGINTWTSDGLTGGTTMNIVRSRGWNRALSAAEVKSLNDNPWQIYKAPPRLLVAASSGPVNVTGTYAATLAVPSMSASGAVVNVGSFAASLAVPTFAASGIVATPPVGSLAATLDAPSFAASGVAFNPGMFSATLEAPTFAASGTAAPHAAGTFSATLAAPSMSAFGFLGAVAPAAPVKPYRWRVLRRHFTPQ